MHLLKQLLQSHLETLILAALVEFTDEMSTGFEGVIRERKGRETEVLHKLISFFPHSNPTKNRVMNPLTILPA